MGQEKSRQTFKISQSNVVPSTSESTGKRPKYAGNRVDGTTDSSAVKFPSRPLPERKLSSSTQSDALDTETYADDGDLYESPTTTNGMKVMDNTWEPSSKPSLYEPSMSHENISQPLGSDCPSDGTNESLHTQSIRGFNTPGNNSNRVLDLSAANSNRRSFPLPTLPSSTQRKTKSNEKDPKDENFNVSPPATNKTELVEIESESSAEPPKAFLDDTPATYENMPYPAKIGSTSQQSSPPKESDFGAESVQTPSMRVFRTFRNNSDRVSDSSAANSNRRSFPLPTLPSSTQRKTKSNEKDPKDENFNVSPPATNKTELVEIESESSAEPPKAFLDDTPATYENTPYPAKIDSTSQQSSPPKESDFGAESVQTPSIRVFRTFHGQGSYINHFELKINNCNVKIIYPPSASETSEADSTDTNSEYTVICDSSRDRSVSNEYVEHGRQVPHGEQPRGSGETVSHQTSDLL